MRFLAIISLVALSQIHWSHASEKNCPIRANIVCHYEINLFCINTESKEVTEGANLAPEYQTKLQGFSADHLTQDPEFNGDIRKSLEILGAEYGRTSPSQIVRFHFQLNQDKNNNLVGSLSEWIGEQPEGPSPLNCHFNI